MTRFSLFYLFSLLLLLSCSNPNVSLTTQEYKLLGEMLDAGFNRESEILTQRIHRLYYELSEFYRFGMKPVNRGIDSLDLSVKGYLNQREKSVTETEIPDGKGYSELTQFVIRNHSKLSRIYLEILEECSETLHLNERKINDIINQHKERNSKFILMKNELESMQKEKNLKVELNLIDGLFLTSQNQLLEDFENLVFSSSYCGFEVFYPVLVNTDFDPNLALGDTLKLSVGIGSYYNTIDPTSTTFLVNGDTVSLLDAGVGYYNKVMEEEGEKNIKMEFWMTNFTTGEIMRGESIYTVNVKQ